MSDRYKYQIEIRPNKYTGIEISHTHNGSQWSTINVKDIAELKQLKNAIDDYIKEHKE
jgi:hypothetical protein